MLQRCHRCISWFVSELVTPPPYQNIQILGHLLVTLYIYCVSHDQWTVYCAAEQRKDDGLFRIFLVSQVSASSSPSFCL